MKVCMVHNAYGKLSGEEVVVEAVCDLLEARGHTVVRYFRSSAELEGRRLGAFQAFLSGVYNPFARRRMRQLLRDEQPDLVHVHNLYPLISPAVLRDCRSAGVPVVMTVHNYRLVCPNGLHLSGGRVCERCCGGREYWCLLKNCEGSLAKSAGYALRGWVARVAGYYRDNVDVFAVLTAFQKARLVAAGYPAARICVVPNMASWDGAPAQTPGDCIGFVGRVSAEKGLETLLAAARLCPDIPFQVAGSYDSQPDLPARAPSNLTFLGPLDRDGVHRFYDRCRAVVLCSTWFEGFPMVLVEAMLHGRPVVCSRIGGLSEIVEEGVTGLLFEPGNAGALADAVGKMWRDAGESATMGLAGCRKARAEYSPGRYYRNLMDAYGQVLRTGGCLRSPSHE